MDNYITKQYLIDNLRSFKEVILDEAYVGESELNRETDRAVDAETWLKDAIDVLNGTGEGSVKKEVSDQIARIVSDQHISLEALEELSQWIEDHPQAASELSAIVAQHTEEIINLQNGKVDKVSGKGLSDVNFTQEYATKLNSVVANAEPNQFAYSSIDINGERVTANNTTDVLNLVGNNVTISGDGIDTTVTIGLTKSNVVSALGYEPPHSNTTYDVATQSSDGLESSADKTKLDGIEAGAQVNIQSDWSVTDNTRKDYIKNKPVNVSEFINDAGYVTSAQAGVTGIKGSDEEDYRAGNVIISPSDIGLGNVENKSSETIRGELTSSDVTEALGYTPPQTDTTYNVVSKQANGLVPKLPNEETTTKYLRQDGTWAELSGAGFDDATEETHGLMSVADKIKLDGIEAGAEVNQNSWGQFRVNGTNVAADVEFDTLNLTSTNITLTPNQTTDTINIGLTSQNIIDALGYTPSGGGGGGGSTVSYSPTLLSGEQTGSITIDGVTTNMYAPEAPYGFAYIDVEGGLVEAVEAEDILVLRGDNITIDPDQENNQLVLRMDATNIADALGFAPTQCVITDTEPATIPDGQIVFIYE